MPVTLRPPTEDDWPAILETANSALPWDERGNRVWLNYRRQFIGQRRHVVAEDTESETVVAYGALEEGPEPGMYRLFVVMAPHLLVTGPGDMVFSYLANAWVDLGAKVIWAREYASDTPTCAFFAARGFAETNRFTPPGEHEMVVLVRELAAD